MRPYLSVLLFSILPLAAALSAPPAATRKEPAPAKPVAEKTAKDTYVPAGGLQGVFRSADGGHITLSVTFRSVQAEGNSVRTSSVTKDVELELADIVKVRSLHPLQAFDDKGNIKKRFTAKELKELKGDPRLPGYTAELTDLQAGQHVSVKLARVRPAKSSDAPAADKKGKGDPLAKSTEPRVVVTLIMIANEAPK